MNYGRYFSLDVNASRLDKGLAVFNYRGFKKKSVKIINDNYREKYPIYVTFSQEEVTFHIHNIEESTSRDYPIQHTNSLILSLPTSLNINIKDNLTQNIINIYRNKFPHNGVGNRLYDYGADSLKNSEQDGKGITYSSLEVFGIIYEPPLGVTRPPIVGLLRKLFLDFLYDLEHSNVFKNAYNFESIYIALNENFLFKAIRNKAEYYYQRKMASRSREGFDTAFDAADKEIFLADQYVESERRWVETITDPRSEVTFHMAKGWLLNAEKEMNAVYESDILSSYKKGKRVEPKSSYNTLRCADFVKRIKFSKSENIQDVTYNKTCIEDSKSTIVDTAKIASNWYVHKYSFSGTLRIWYGKSYWIRTIVFVTSVALLLLSIIVPSWIKLMNSLTVVVGVVILLSIWRAISLCKERLKRIGSINILMPRLFAAITTAWFTLAIGEDVFKGFFDTVLSYWTSVALLAVTFFFVAYEIGKINPFISSIKVVGRSFALIGVAFIYSFIAGLLVVHFFGSKYLERSDYIDEFYANNIYVEFPEFHMTNVPEYVHNHFYEQVNKYNSKLLDSIVKLKISYDTTKMGLPLITSYLTKYKYPIMCNGRLVNRDSVEYGKTLLLLSVFTSGSGDSGNKIDELHQHMMDGSLVGYRIRKVMEYVSNQKELVLDSVSLAKLGVGYNKNMIPNRDAISDHSWIELLKSVDNHALYRETLKYLSSTSTQQMVVSEYLGINIFRELLLQFTFFAMFIGIFLQLIFEDKSVTEPI